MWGGAAPWQARAERCRFRPPSWSRDATTMAAKKKSSLVDNINKRKKAGTSRPKKRSTVSKESYDAMESGWGAKTKKKSGGAKKKSTAKKKTGGGAKKKAGGAKKKTASKK
jgi:hypothetical protein